MSFPSAPFGFLDPQQAAATVVLTNHATEFTDTDNDGTPWTYSVAVTFENDGTLSYTRGIGSDGDIASEWLTSYPDTVNAALYEIACTENAQTGAASRVGDAVGTWQTLDTNRTWSITNTTSGDATWDLDFTIRDVATQTTQATATLTLDTIDGFT